MARAQGSAAMAAGRAGASALMNQSKIAGFALQTRHSNQNTDRKIQHLRDERKMEDEFATLDAIGDLIGFTAELASKAYEIDRQNQYDKAALSMTQRKARMFRRLEDNKYRMEPENPADPASPMVQRSNHDQLYTAYNEEMARAEEHILSGISNDAAKRQLQQKWDEERVAEEGKVISTAKAWKTEQDLLDTNTAIAEYTKLGQFDEALTSLKSAYSNAVIGPGEYAEAKAKLDSDKTVWAVEEAILDITVTGADGGAAKITALESRLTNAKDLAELGAKQRTQYLGVLDSIQTTWREEANRVQRAHDKASTDKLRGTKAGMTSAIAAAEYDIATGSVETGQKKARSLLKFIDNSPDVKPEDKATLRGKVENGVAGAMVSHVGHLQNITGDTEKANAEIQKWIGMTEEELGFVPGSGGKETAIANARTAMGINKSVIKAREEASFNSYNVTSILSGQRSATMRYDGYSSTGAEINDSEKDALNRTDSYVQEMKAYQEATGDESGEPTLAQDAEGYQAQVYSRTGAYPTNFAKRQYDKLRSENPELIIEAANQVSRFNSPDITGGGQLYESLIKDMGPVEKELHSYVEVMRDKMGPEQLMASVGQYIADSKKAGYRIDENKAATEAYVGSTDDFNAVLRENLERDGLDPDMFGEFEANNPEFVEHMKTLLEYNVARSPVPAVNFTNAYHEARMSFGLDDSKGFYEFSRDNLVSKTSKEPNPWVTDDYRNAAVIGGVMEEVMDPAARQVVFPAGDGIWHVQVIGADGQPVMVNRSGAEEVWTYEYNEETIPGFVKDRKEKAALGRQTRYENGINGLMLMKQTYPTPLPTHAEAFVYPELTEAGRKRHKINDLYNQAAKEVRKIAPRYAYLHPDNEVTRAIDPEDFDLKGTIRLAKEQIDAEFDKYILDHFRANDQPIPPNFYQMREDAKYAAEYNLKHRNYEEWREGPEWAQERAAILRQQQREGQFELKENPERSIFDL